MFLATPLDSKLLVVLVPQGVREELDFDVEALLDSGGHGLLVLSLAEDDLLVRDALLGDGALDFALTVADRTTFVGITPTPDYTRFLTATVQVSYQTEFISPEADPPMPDDESKTDGNDDNGQDESIATPKSISEPSLMVGIWLGLVGQCAFFFKGLIWGNRQ